MKVWKVDALDILSGCALEISTIVVVLVVPGNAFNFSPNASGVS